MIDELIKKHKTKENIITTLTNHNAEGNKTVMFTYTGHDSTKLPKILKTIKNKRRTNNILNNIINNKMKKKTNNFDKKRHIQANM